MTPFPNRGPARALARGRRPAPSAFALTRPHAGARLSELRQRIPCDSRGPPRRSWRHRSLRRRPALRAHPPQGASTARCWTSRSGPSPGRRWTSPDRASRARPRPTNAEIFACCASLPACTPSSSRSPGSRGCVSRSRSSPERASCWTSRCRSPARPRRSRSPGTRRLRTAARSRPARPRISASWRPSPRPGIPGGCSGRFRASSWRAWTLEGVLATPRILRRQRHARSPEYDQPRRRQPVDRGVLALSLRLRLLRQHRRVDRRERPVARDGRRFAQSRDQEWHQSPPRLRARVVHRRVPMGIRTRGGRSPVEGSAVALGRRRQQLLPR